MWGTQAEYAALKKHEHQVFLVSALGPRRLAARGAAAGFGVRQAELR